jgi:hypothetical protein
MKKWIPWAIVGVLVAVIIYLVTQAKSKQVAPEPEETVIIDQQTGDESTVVESTGPIPSSGK